MNLNHKYISIGAILIILVLVIYQIQAQNSYEDEIDALKHSQDSALQLSKDTIAQLQATIVTLNRQLTAEAGRNANGNQSTNNGALASNGGAALAGPPANATVQAQTMQERIRSMMNSPAIKQAASKMMVNQMYGDFIRGLHLSPSEKEALSQIFANTMSQKNELALKLSAHEISQADYNAAIKEADSKLRDQLSGYLYKDEMTAFDQYEATKDTRAAARLQQNQEIALQTAAPDLTPESRAYVAKVLTEEFTKGGAVAGLGNNPPQNLQNIAGIMDARNQQMDNAMQRIRSEGALDKTQVSVVEDYITQQKSMQDAAGQMLNGLLKK